MFLLATCLMLHVHAIFNVLSFIAPVESRVQGTYISDSGGDDRCKNKLDPCTISAQHDGICDAFNVCKPFREVSFEQFSDEDFRKLAPLLVEEAEKWQKGTKLETFLSAEQMNAILSAGVARARAWWSEPLVELDVPEPGKLVLLGDTHGQLHDVLWIFSDQGRPSPSNVYLFNGDICDRGTEATTIWSILLVYKLSDKNIVHVNRGNHEDRKMHSLYGFYKEVMAKFPNGADIYAKFLSISNILPIYTIIQRKFFVVHAGLPRVRNGNVTIADLKRVNHKRPCPFPGSDDDAIFFDSMWADPQSSVGIHVNRHGEGRGRGTSKFGPDVTARFLRSTKLEKVFRSHQPKRDEKWAGIESFHDGAGYTVFSASNYYSKIDDLGNLAAVISFRMNATTSELDIRVARHYARRNNNSVMTWSEVPLESFGQHNGVKKGSEDL